jgi:hypothetical protein
VNDHERIADPIVLGNSHPTADPLSAGAQVFDPEGHVMQNSASTDGEE